MHKSTGNAIWFDDAAEEIGVDVRDGCMPHKTLKIIFYLVMV